MNPRYLQLIKLLARMASKGAGKVPEKVKGMPSGRKSDYKINFGLAKKGLAKPKDFTEKGRRLRKGEVDTPYQKRGLGGSKKSQRSLSDKEVKERGNHLVQQMQSEFRGTPQGPPLSTSLSKALTDQAKKGNLNPQGRLKRLDTSPEQFVDDLAGGSLRKGSPGPVKYSPEEYKVLKEFMDVMKRLKKNDAKSADHPWGPMKSGDASLNAALLSALGAGAGAAGLADALRNRSRGSAGGSPQSPSR